MIVDVDKADAGQSLGDLGGSEIAEPGLTRGGDTSLSVFELFSSVVTVRRLEGIEDDLRWWRLTRLCSRALN